MSNDQCLTQEQFTHDVNLLCGALLQHYNKNIETELNQNEEELLNNTTNKLAEVSESLGVSFNRDEFKSFIKKLFVYDLTQFGGDEGDEDENLNEVALVNSSRIQYVYDFTAILGFIVSICLLYLAYDNLTQLTESISGTTPVGISESVAQQVMEAKRAVENLNTSNLTWIQFFYEIISTFSCSIANKQVEQIKEIIEITLAKSFIGYRDRASALCTSGDKTNSASWRIFSAFGNMVSSSEATKKCISDTTSLEFKRITTDIEYVKDTLFIQLNTKSSQIIGNIQMAAYIGTPCTLYLISRSKQLLQPMFTKATVTKPIEDSKELKVLRITERGGKRRTMKKHKKSIKKNKKHRKKHSRKNKRRSRK
jgi:hypothetical protein